MPTRLLRDGIVDSRAVNSLSDSAEIFYRRLFAIVDDYGRFEADVELLRARLFARQLDRRSLTDVGQMLAECCQARISDEDTLIVLYRVKGKKFLQINRFGQRERTPSKFPPPNDGELLTNDREPLTIACSRARASESESESESESYICASSDAQIGDAHSNSQPTPNPREGWFTEFWMRYKAWRNCDKKRARLTFLKLVKTEALFQRIIRAVDQQTPEMMGREPGKRPHAATWLNAERWGDGEDGEATSTATVPEPVDGFGGFAPMGRKIS